MVRKVFCKLCSFVSFIFPSALKDEEGVFMKHLLGKYPTLENSKEICSRIMSLIEKVLQSNPDDRMTMVDVLRTLKFIESRGSSSIPVFD